jgi:hypothetical protein
MYFHAAYTHIHNTHAHTYTCIHHIRYTQHTHAYTMSGAEKECSDIQHTHYAYTHMHTYTHTTHTCTHTHTRIHTHAYIHTCINTHACTISGTHTTHTCAYTRIHHIRCGERTS